MSYQIRLATLDDVPALGPVEVAAGQLFKTVGMGHLSHKFMEPEMAAAFVRAKGCFVAEAEDGALAGFAMSSPLDHSVFVHEISVDPAHGRRGIGQRLLNAVSDWAKALGKPAVTLSTFTDVPWNAPYYGRQGFSVVEREDWSPAFFIIHAHEEESGLPIDRRCFMRKEL